MALHYDEIFYRICLDCRVFEYFEPQTAALWHDGHNIRRRVVPFIDNRGAAINRDSRAQAFRAAELDIKKLLTLPPETVN